MAEGGLTPTRRLTKQESVNVQEPTARVCRRSRNKNVQPGRPKCEPPSMLVQDTEHDNTSKPNALNPNHQTIRCDEGRKMHRSNVENEDRTLGVQTSYNVHVEDGQMKLLKMKMHAKTSDKVSFNLDEETSIVTVTGISPDEITEERLRLHEQLENMCERKAKVTSSQAELLGRVKTMRRIDDVCKRKELEVAVSVKQDLLRCYAFTDEDAYEVLQLIKDKLRMSNVRLQPGQSDLIQGQKWQELLEQLSETLGIAYLSEDSSEVIVEGFTRKGVETTRQKVVEFLGKNAVLVKTKLELNGAKAKCFQKLIRHNLEKKIRAMGGTMKVEIVQSEPLSLNLTVEGEECVTKETTDCLDGIQSKVLDLRDMSRDDKWLVIKGFAGEQGKPFFKRFENENNCVIDVTEEGIVHPPARNVNQGRISYQRQRSYSDPSPEHERRPHKTDHRRGLGLDEYKPAGLTEEEALQLALKKSVQEDDQDDVFEPEDLDCDGDSDGNRDQPICAGLSSQINRESSELQPGHGMSLYQPKHMTEDESFKRASRMSVDADHSCSSRDEEGIIPSHYREFGSSSPRRHSHKDFSKNEPRRHSTAKLYRLNTTQQFCGTENTGSKWSETGTRSRQCGNQQFCRKTSEYGDAVNITMHGAKVVLKRGHIANFKADGLVNVVGPAMILDDSMVSKSFLKVGGQQLSKLFHQQIQKGVGPVIVTPSCGDLLCRSVYHVVLAKGADNCTQSVQSAVTRILDICVQCQYQSAAFPPLGVGRMYSYDPSASAKAMLKATQNFFAKNQFNVVTFVIYEKDDSVYNAFKRVFTSWEKEQLQFDVNDLMCEQLQATIINPLDILQRPLKLMFGQLSGIDATRENTSRGRRTRFSRQKTKDEDYVRRQSSLDLRQRRRDVKEDMNNERAAKKESMFPPEGPVKNLVVIVHAETPERCSTARTKLDRAVREEFLFEEPLKKSQAVTPQTKEKIVTVITKHGVKSIKEQGGYIIKGNRESVRLAVKEILQILADSTGDAGNILHEKRQRRTKAGRETHDYVKYMVQEEPNVPIYWKHFKPGHPVKSVIADLRTFVKDSKHIQVKLDSTDPIYTAIISMINNTWDASTRGLGRDASGLDQCNYTKMNVTKIERIENLDLYQEYSQKRVKMFTQLYYKGAVRYPEIFTLRGCTKTIDSVQYADTCLLEDMNAEINEFYFFHGTKSENVRAICDSGLDNRLANGSAMFGQGIYGAETPSKADQYVDDKDRRTVGRGRTKQMFLMRMILGNAFICKDPNPHKYKRPPCTKCQRDDCRDHSEMYDSVIGDNRKLFREFVVYDKELCYPEYLISYERR